MHILSECKSIITYAGLNNAKHIQIGGKMIHRTFIRCAVVSLLTLATIIEITVCVKGRKSVDQILLPLHLGLSSTASLIIYIRLMSKSESINELIDYLEEIVNKRNFFADFSGCSAWILKRFIYIFPLFSPTKLKGVNYPVMRTLFITHKIWIIRELLIWHFEPCLLEILCCTAFQRYVQRFIFFSIFHHQNFGS